MKYAYLFWLPIPIGILTVILSSTSISVFSSTLENNTALEKALKSLEENQKGSSSIPPMPFANQSSTDSIQEPSKITKLSASTSKYENSDYGISITFPGNWKLSEVNLPQHGITMFNAPELGNPLSAEYVFDPATVLLASQKLPVNNMTLVEFIISFLKDRYPNATDYKIIQSKSDKLAGMGSEKIIMYEYDVPLLLGGSSSSKIMRNIAIDDKTGTVYMINYTAHPGTFSKYLPIAEQMMNSLQLTK
jgi:hypothetical protein